MIFKLKERMEIDIKNEYKGNSFSPTSIQWVLTIPAKWTDRAETFIRKCAEKVIDFFFQIRVNCDILNYVLYSKILNNNNYKGG